jgi:DNA-binding IclR family transcriptional regulator
MAKRHELSLQEKIEVLDEVKKQPHSSQRELAELFKIPRTITD